MVHGAESLDRLMDCRRESPIPESKVFVRDGRVVKVEDWCRVNGEDAPIITVELRKDGQFRCAICDPEHGSPAPAVDARIEGAVLQRLHPEVARKYIEAFRLDHPTDADLKRLFPRHRIMREQ